MAVTVYARSVNDMGVVQPGRSVRYQEECTPRSWTVSAMPRTQRPPGPDEENQTPTNMAPRIPPPIRVTVDVRPGEVSRVEL